MTTDFYDLQNKKSFEKRRASFSRRLLSILLAGSFALTTGCSMLPREVNEPEISSTATKPKVPEKSEWLNQSTDESLLSVPIHKNVLVPRPLDHSDPLPNINIERYNAYNATVFETFRLLLEDSGISVAADPTARDIRLSAVEVSGPLPRVIEQLCDAAGIFYTYRNKSLRIGTEQSFVVPLPPMSDAFEGMTSMIEAIGGENVHIDSFGRVLTFRSNRTNFENIRAYLEQVRESKVLIVYETYFFEVALNDSNQVGINWDNLQWATSEASLNLTTSSAVQDSISIGAVLTKGNWDLDGAVDFLQTQGDVEILSKPIITVVSGNQASFEVGGTIRYVAEVGTTTSEGATTTTVNTEDLLTGLTLTLTGDFHDETVFTKVDLEVSDFIEFTEFNAVDTQLQLPQTTNRKLSTMVRVRPGDTILIAGINQTRDTKTTEGAPGIMDVLPFLKSRDRQAERSELVIIMQPRVLRFVEPAMASSRFQEKMNGVPDAQPTPLIKPEETSAPQNILPAPAAIEAEPAQSAPQKEAAYEQKPPMILDNAMSEIGTAKAAPQVITTRAAAPSPQKASLTPSVKPATKPAAIPAAKAEVTPSAKPAAAPTALTAAPTKLQDGNLRIKKMSASEIVTNAKANHRFFGESASKESAPQQAAATPDLDALKDITPAAGTESPVTTAAHDGEPQSMSFMWYDAAQMAEEGTADAAPANSEQAATSESNLFEKVEEPAPASKQNWARPNTGQDEKDFATSEGGISDVPVLGDLFGLFESILPAAGETISEEAASKETQAAAPEEAAPSDDMANDTASDAVTAPTDLKAEANDSNSVPGLSQQWQRYQGLEQIAPAAGTGGPTTEPSWDMQHEKESAKENGNLKVSPEKLQNLLDYQE